MNESSVKNGLGVLPVLQIIFLVLKLCGLIKWQWWKVLIPLWIDLGIAFVFIVILIVIRMLEKHKKKKKRG